MSDSHRERIRKAFTSQAATLEDTGLNLAFTSSVPWLLEYLSPGPGDVVIDVAGGTGIVSRALAARVTRAVVVDSTPAMIDQGRRQAESERLTNLAFVRGAVDELPFAEGTFTLVFARFALHHLVDPRPALREMARVSRTGGRVVVMDLVSSGDPRIAAEQDRIERLRDDSHVRMPSRGVVADWFRDCGLTVAAVAEREIDRPVEAWLRQSATGAEAAAAVREAFEAELAGGAQTGMRPHRAEDGAVWFHQRWEITSAHKA
ncbi:class I SAM-dependent methyltransferase [Mycobacterium sp. NPDC003449]